MELVTAATAVAVLDGVRRRWKFVSAQAGLVPSGGVSAAVLPAPTVGGGVVCTLMSWSKALLDLRPPGLVARLPARTTAAGRKTP